MQQQPFYFSEAAKENDTFQGLWLGKEYMV
jgi:hypothetical protein